VIDEQVAGCRRALESQLGRAMTSFAYPNGAVNEAARAAVARAGFRLAVTTRHGVNYRDTDPYQLRRVPLGRERPFHLALKLAFYAWVHRD
jgi:peptidoglycan/xylan/chitin deacetylase (PgdA/CDA1 family)